MATFEPTLSQVLLHKHKASELGATLDTRYVLKTGDTMTGSLNLPGLNFTSSNLSITLGNTQIAFIDTANFFNTGYGKNAINPTATGFNNIAFGSGVLSALSSGNYNLAIGDNSLLNLTTGQYNVGIGLQSLQFLITNQGNFGIGVRALQNIADDFNYAIGFEALKALVTGQYNCVIGNSVMVGANNCYYNTVIGHNALSSLTGDFASSNTVIGEEAGKQNLTGSSNIFIGFQSGYFETGSNKLFIDNIKRASEADARVKGLLYGVFNASVASQSLTLNGNYLINGKITNYNNINTTGQGVPAIYGNGRSTAQTAAVSSVATYTVGSSDGSFIVSANVLVTTATAHNFNVQVTYTDEGGTSRTVTFNVQQLGGTLVTAITNVTGAGPYEGVPLHIRAKASTAITILTSGTFTTVTYNVEGVIQQIS